MRKNFISAAIILFVTLSVTFLSCQREFKPPTQPPPVVNNPSNRPPQANAGIDTSTTLPGNTVILDGSATDPDNNISTYRWTKVDGPSTFSIVNANSLTTQAANLVEGVYHFELKVTDAGGLFARDTVKVTVNPDLSMSIEWQKALGGTRTDIANFIEITADGGYIVAGRTNSQDGDVTGYHPGVGGCYLDCFNNQVCENFPDALVIKLNGTGTIQWQKSLGGSGADNSLCIQPTADGGYIMSGYTNSNDGDVSGYHGGIGSEVDGWVVKLSSSGAIQWQKVLGGTHCDYANQVLSTHDGGYIIVGHTESNDGDVTSTHGEKDVWIIKLSSNGSIVWQKTLGGTNNDYAYALQSTQDGGYIIAGNTESNDGDVSGNHGGQDVWVVKLSVNGAILWQKALGGSNDENAQSIEATGDGGYIVAGQTKSNNGDVSGNHGAQDAWIVKLNGSGTIQWQKALGGNNDENAQSIVPTGDGGYIVAGQTKSNYGDVSGNHGSQDAWIVKLSGIGTIQWQKTMGGNNNEDARSIQLTPDGGFIVAGQTYSNNGDVSGNHGDSDAWVIKLK
jgi:hypothetical protein